MKAHSAGSFPENVHAFLPLEPETSPAPTHKET